VIALIDGDVLVYVIGFSSQTTDKENDCIIPEEEWIAKARMDTQIKNIQQITGANDYKIYLSDSKNNFRKQLFPLYKANRTQEKPFHYELLINYLLDVYDTEVAFDQEADDALGIHQCQNPDTIICSIDKDLLQIPGKHYDFRKDVFHSIKPTEGLYRFYKQILVGDSTDNITPATGLSCPGVGEKRAAAVLEGCTNESEYFAAVKDMYFKKVSGTEQEILDRLLLTGQLLKIRTKPEELWSFPIISN